MWAASKCNLQFWHRWYAWLVLLALFPSLLFLYISASNWLVNNQLKIANKEVTVLVWHWPFEKTFELNSCRSRFNITGCHLTANRELFSVADAVLIHHREIQWNLSNLPEEPRPPFQKWIWMNFESPSNSQRPPHLNDQFNLTMNYRRDADISLPYGAVIKRTKETTPFVPRKNKLVCWIVSNWRYEQRRVWYYRNLSRFISVQVYGRAFFTDITELDYRRIVASCKFYLAFENSIHKDYITEKVYRPLRLGSVPVVLGPKRKNYEKFIPGDAFIHVDDFPSPQALAKYLLRLDKDEALYNKYFKWKRNHQVSLTVFPIQHACYSCHYIRQHHSRKQIVTNLATWYWGAKPTGQYQLEP